MLPLLAPLDVSARILGLPSLSGAIENKFRMAGEGPKPSQKPQVSLKPGTPFYDSEGQLKIWGGPNYGPQSPEAWEKLTGQENVNIAMAQARGSLPEPGKAPPLEIPPPPPVGETGTNFPETSEEAQKTEDPYLTVLTDLVKRFTPEEINAQKTADFERLLAAQAALAEQSMRKGEEISRRQIEQTKLNNWANLEQTRIAANLTGSALVGQAMYLSAQPNVNTIAAMNEGLKTALSPFQTKLGVRA